MDNLSTGSKGPLYDPSHVSQTLRTMARMLERLADDYERQVNAQNGQLNAALGNAELGWENQAGDITKRLAALEAAVAQLTYSDGANGHPH